MTEALPQAISESVLDIAGVKLRVYMLDDGRRIINADDVAQLFQAFEDGNPLSEDDTMTLARELRGMSS